MPVLKSVIGGSLTSPIASIWGRASELAGALRMRAGDGAGRLDGLGRSFGRDSLGPGAVPRRTTAPVLPTRFASRATPTTSRFPVPGSISGSAPAGRRDRQRPDHAAGARRLAGARPCPEASGRRRDFTVRLNRLFLSDGWRGIRQFQKMARHCSRLGFGVELQVRYHPGPQQNGDIGAWLDP